MESKAEIERIGRNVALLRRHMKFSQEELSHSAEIARSTLQNIEAGKVDPHLSTLINLAQALDVSLERLVQV